MSNYHVFRLLPGQDLKKGILQYCNDHGIKAGAVVTCVGSLSYAVIRMADGELVREFERPYEIVSLTGTIADNGGHFHIALSDRDGAVIGGHLMEGCIINTTAETVIADLSNTCELTREYDPATGYKELVKKDR